jgi:DNA protecting protein DprA
MNQRQRPQPSDSTDWSLETVGLLGLAGWRGVGYWTLRKLTESGVRFSDVLAMSDGDEVRTLLRSVGARLSDAQPQDWGATRDVIWDRGLRMVAELQALDIKVIHQRQDMFPRSLNDLEDPPYWLFVQGVVGVLHEPSMTVVGARQPSDDGVFLTSFVGASLPYLRVPTVSGLASGIDEQIHRASLRFKVPTIAVLGTGMLFDYPKGSEPLRNEIVSKGGAIITEYLPKEHYSAENFVRRNRLQAALGKILVPVEWAARSGTAHTVRFAQRLQRPIACLRLPDWDEIRTPFRTFNIPADNVFTIPGQESEFRDFIVRQLPYAAKSEPHQPDLFG